MSAWVHYKKKAVFVPVPKTGSTSVMTALTKSLGGRKLMVGRPHRPWLSEHPTAIELKSIHGWWDRYWSFSVVRNPWAWVVSNWFYFRRRAKSHHPMSKIVHSTDSVSDFAHKHLGDLSPQYFWTHTRDGEQMVEYICHRETLTDDFRVVASLLGTNATLPWLNKTKHDHYSRYYDDEAADIVGHHFAMDVMLFDYKFERL